MYRDSIQEINARRQKISTLRKEMREIQRDIKPEEVTDYVFGTISEPVRLSELFGDKDTLFMIHNMGKSCPSCTQWADGFNGALDHLEDCAAFVVSSPDSPEEQRIFAKSRDWKFTMVSHADTNFAQDMGYKSGGFWPGVSVFKMAGNKVVRVSDAMFGPGDDFNPIYNFLAMLPEGDGDWEPKYSYR